MRFQDLDAFTPADIEAAIEREDPDELPLVPVIVVLAAPAPEEAQEVCFRLCRHPDPRVRGNAIMSLGHLARRFRVLDETRARRAIEDGLADQQAEVRILAKSAADEAHQFLGWTFAGHTFG